MDLLDPTVPIAARVDDVDDTELRGALIQAAGTIAAAQARFAQALARFRSHEGHTAGSGYTSFGQWASVELGLAGREVNVLADAGDAVISLSPLREAWESGELSTAKVATIGGVATSESVERWCTIAREASLTQLRRIASAYRRSNSVGDTADDDRKAASSREHQVGLWWRDRGDLVELTAVLEPDDAAVVRAAIEAQMEAEWRGSTAQPPTDEPARRSPSARRLDALVGLAATGLEAGPVPIVRGERTEVILHIDHDYLTGVNHEGRCHFAGPGTGRSIGVDRGTARRLTCDARIRALVHGADGSGIDLGRSQRLVSDKQRRLLTARDHGCRFPGCTNTRFVDAHHVVHWADGGATDLSNLITLCNRHHRLHHQGVFDITVDAEGNFTFLDRWNQPMRPADPGPPGRCRPSPDVPRARSGGDPRYDIDLTVTALAGSAA